jgi:hypothetical protein
MQEIWHAQNQPIGLKDAADMHAALAGVWKKWEVEVSLKSAGKPMSEAESGWVEAGVCSC